MHQEWWVDFPCFHSCFCSVSVAIKLTHLLQHLQLLLFDSHGLSLAAILDPNSNLEVNAQLEATLWSMVDYNTMSSSSGPMKHILPASVPDATLLPSSLDFETGFSQTDDGYSNIMSVPNMEPTAPDFLGQGIGCSL